MLWFRNKCQGLVIISLVLVLLTVLSILFSRELLPKMNRNQVKAQNNNLPIFPGAEGFGTNTRAAYGNPAQNPVILKVTNLNDSGLGSLRAALMDTRPRVVIFEVGGIIWLQSDITITNPYVTIAGQTAPSPGVTMAHYTFRIKTHDVLVQHLYFRFGNKTGLNGFAINGRTDGSDETFNIVVDHCSISWAPDKNLIIWTSTDNLPVGAVGAHDITVTDTIIAESLLDPATETGYHHMGFLIGDHSKRISVIRNLMAHNQRRNPTPFGNTSTIIANNLVYNPGNGAIHFQDHEVKNGALFSSTVGNVIIPGVDTYDAYWCNPNSACKPICVYNNVANGTKIYLYDNEAPGRTNDPWSVARDDSQCSHDFKALVPPIWLENLTVLPSSQVKEYVLANAGARPWDRDEVDKRIVNDVINGTGRIIDSQNDVNSPRGSGDFGWPKNSRGPTYHQLTTPKNPHQDDNQNGYANLEDWLYSFTSSHCSPLGDIDCSGKVNALDFGHLVRYWGLDSLPAANLDDTGVVNREDALILLGNYGKSN